MAEMVLEDASAPDALLTDIGNVTDKHEINVLMAEQVMGWHQDGPYWLDSEGRGRGNAIYMGDGEGGEWSPCTDIAAAWEVVEEMIRRGFGLVLYTPKTDYADSQGMRLKNEYCATFQHPGLWHSAWAETAPLAICRAALAIEQVAGSW